MYTSIWLNCKDSEPSLYSQLFSVPCYFVYKFQNTLDMPANLSSSLESITALDGKETSVQSCNSYPLSMTKALQIFVNFSSFLTIPCQEFGARLGLSRLLFLDHDDVHLLLPLSGSVRYLIVLYKTSM